MFLQRRRDHSLHSGYTETAVKLSFVLSFFHKLLLTKKNCFFSHLLLFAYTSKMSFLCRLQLIKNNLEHSVKLKKKGVDKMQFTECTFTSMIVCMALSQLQPLVVCRHQGETVISFPSFQSLWGHIAPFSDHFYSVYTHWCISFC